MDTDANTSFSKQLLHRGAEVQKIVPQIPSYLSYLDKKSAGIIVLFQALFPSCQIHDPKKRLGRPDPLYHLLAIGVSY